MLIRKNAQINSDTLMKDGGTPSSGGRRKEKKKEKKNPHSTTNPECARTYKVANSRAQNTTESRERRARKERR